jgi:hypothetical protein
MAFELKNGAGFIFKNKNKTANIHPDYKGDIKTPGGENLTISLWVKEGDRGKFFSVSVQQPYKKEGTEISSDDLPF